MALAEPSRLGAASHDLRAAVRGEVAADAGHRAAYAADASNYRLTPRAVVFPRDAADVAAAVAACRRHGLPVTARGAGTSVAGNAIGTGVVLDLSRHLNRIVSIDPAARTAVVEPGVVLDDLRAAAAAYGLTFGPDPSTHARCTLGGMIGNNACGSHSLAWGRTSDNVLSLDVLRYDGTRLTVGPDTIQGDGAEPLREALVGLRDRYLGDIRTGLGRFLRQVSGYALEHLLPERGFDLAKALVGTEGTCAVVLAATVRLVVPPASRTLVVLGFADSPAAADAVPAILDRRPIAVEGIDDLVVETLRRHRPDEARAATGVLPPGDAWLYVEFDDPDAAQALAAGHDGAAVVTDAADQRRLWRLREDGAGLATRLPDGTEAWPGWEDAAVPPDRLGAYLRDFKALLGRHGRRGVIYGHFGDGCLHVRIDFDLDDRAGLRDFMRGACELVARHGGSFSGEHGDGHARAEFLPLLYPPPLLDAFAEFKRIWDPDDGLNPGVLISPRAVDEDLRVRVLPLVETAFRYDDDGGDLGRALRRCVGVGKCRTASGGVMCPSWRATRDERHSTRGRARLLYEMLIGETITRGWRSREVRDALDLCLSCKGCRRDCPVDVDMATYKAEFLYHHYRGRLRPPAHYALGWRPVWARLASVAPGLANAVAPGLRRLGGIDRRRAVPRFAAGVFGAGSFRRWFRGRRPVGDGTPVMLWVDTFTEYFTPAVGRAAVAVLEAAGYRVEIPARRVCCGLTWISTGQLGVARRVLGRTVDALAGTDLPIVGLEPSCTATLRTDLPELLADPRAAAVAGRMRTFAEALADWTPPSRLDTAAVAQPHCHQYATAGYAADAALLARAGVAVDTVEGCCGLAGDFGFTHHDVSVAVAGQSLLPALRPDALTLADGFSCRTQITQLTDATPLHLAELLARTL